MSRFRLIRWLWLLTLWAIPLLASGTGDRVRHHWGRGLWLPAQRLLIGGYANLTYKHLRDGQDHGSLDDLSLFLTWTPHPRVRLFSELELEDLITIHKDSIDSDRRFFSVERLYLDYLGGENWHLRLGKFLTPVGRWNVIHAAPLVWTTSRPLVTTHLFAPHASGAMVSAGFTPGDHDLDLSLYFDASEDLDPKRNPVSFRIAGGLRLNYAWSEHLETGVSYLHFKMARPVFQPDTDLFGLDFRWRWQGFEISGEFAHRRPNDGHASETGLYTQAVVPLGHHLFGVGRYEFIRGTHFLEEGTRKGDAHLQIVGLAWRPKPPLVLKLEYRFGQHNRQLADDGWLMSIATLF